MAAVARPHSGNPSQVPSHCLHRVISLGWVDIGQSKETTDDSVTPMVRSRWDNIPAKAMARELTLRRTEGTAETWGMSTVDLVQQQRVRVDRRPLCQAPIDRYGDTGGVLESRSLCGCSAHPTLSLSL